MWKLNSKTGRRLAMFTATSGAALAVAGFLGVAPSAAATTHPTVSASCVAQYQDYPSVGVTTISWTSAPVGAEVKVVGYVTEFRDAPTPTGSVLLPGLPLTNADLKVYRIYLVDTAGTAVAGPTGLVLCTSPTSTTTSPTSTTTSPTSTTTSPTSTTTSPTSTTSSSSTSTSPTTTRPTTTRPTGAGYDQGGDVESRGPNMVLVGVGGVLLLLALAVRQPRLVISRGKYQD